MKPVTFPEVNVELAKDQPEYRILPAHRHKDLYVSCWKLSFKERIKILFTGLIWCQQITFFNPLQPQKLSIDKPIL